MDDNLLGLRRCVVLRQYKTNHNKWKRSTAPTLFILRCTVFILHYTTLHYGMVTADGILHTILITSAFTAA